MKIAVVAVGYKCPNLEEVLTPWLKASKKYDLKICSVSALFKERQEMGEKYDNKEMDDILMGYVGGGIEGHLATEKPILDFESRNMALSYFKIRKYDFDYLWQLDLFDEYYTEREITETLEWVKENNLYDFYRVNFKNYFGKIEDKTYVLDFKPVRIINNRHYNGIKRFFFDNDVEFQDGTTTPNCAGITIPRRVCNPKHLSWVGDKEFLTNKIKYQKKAIGCCSYTFDEDKRGLRFDLEGYYKKFGLLPPEVYND
jgi:hypothetical protein